MPNAEPVAVDAVILAAGQGTRMRSALPKVLHPVGGRPMLALVVDAVRALGGHRVHVVVGRGAELVRDAFADSDVQFVEQTEQLGTGHAMQQVAPLLDAGSVTLMLYGDGPLVRPDSLARLLDAGRDGLAVLTAQQPDPTGLGRILRAADGAVIGIVEEKDASPEQRAITETNTGIMAAPTDLWQRWLPQLSNDNAQGEYYVTDLVAMAVADGVPVAAVQPGSIEEVGGINDRVQLAAAERIWQRWQAEALMRAGVTVADPARLDIRGRVSAGQDCRIDVNVVFEGEVELGDGVQIGPNCLIRDARIAAGAVVHANCVIEDAVVGPDASVGPFARLRTGTDLGAGARIGNFVETKKARLGAGSKANHLAYLGDTTLGDGCNIGAGTITCNYDGMHKHPTTIGDGVFVGSNSTLVAPVELDAGSFVAAGSTITSRVRSQELAVGRGKQRNISGWIRPDQRTKKD